MILRAVIISVLSFFVFASVGLTQEKILSLLDKAAEVYYSNPDRSYEYCQEAREFVTPETPDSLISEIELNEAVYFLVMADLDRAGDLLNSVQAREPENSPRLAQAYKLKSNLMLRLEDIVEGRRYLIKAIDIYTVLGDTDNLVGAKGNLFLQLVDDGDLKAAGELIEELKTYRNFIQGIELYFYYQNLGLYEKMIGNLEGAEEFFLMAHGVTEEYEMLDSRATILMELGNVNAELGNLQQAISYFHEGITLAEEHNFIHEKAELLAGLLEVYLSQGKMDLAFETQTELHSIENEIYDLEKINHINAVERQLRLAKYEQDLLSKDYELIERDARIKTQKLEQAEQKSQKRILLLVLGAMVLVAAVILYALIRMRKLNKEIQLQKNKVEEKNLIIGEALADINDSLAYTKRLQESMLPNLHELNSSIQDSFIYYEPKQIVSGDFYWTHKQNGLTAIAVADCTGHGVPGALVSIVCMNALNQSAKEIGIKDAGKLVDLVRNKVVNAFTLKSGHVLDGMDLSLVVIDSNRKIQWVGANNPLWIISNKTDEVYGEDVVKNGKHVLREIKPDKQAIGYAEKYEPFTSHSVELDENDVLILLTDGYADQFGGNRNKKFKSGSLKQLLLAAMGTSFDEIPHVLHRTHLEWRGDIEQLDDICVMGIKV